jgi:hypothetical protein
MTLDDLENDEVFSAAVKGLPKVVELIAAIPEEKRSLALAAAQQSYLQTAQAVGYDGRTCRGSVEGNTSAGRRKVVPQSRSRSSMRPPASSQE